MNKLTKLTGVVALSTLMATTAIAQTPNAMAVPAASASNTSITASNADLDFAFASTDKLEVTGMDTQEMQETQGAGWWYVIPIALTFLLKGSSSDNNGRD